MQVSGGNWIAIVWPYNEPYWWVGVCWMELVFNCAGLRFLQVSQHLSRRAFTTSPL